MSMTRDSRRRWLGGIFLGISAVMLLLGTTVLKAKLQRESFIYYWLTCVVFVLLTMIVALLDFRAVRMRSRAEQRQLIEETLREMGRRKEEKQNGPKPE